MMDMEKAIKIEAAVPDSHFRLLPCPECGGDNVAYVQYMLGRQEPLEGTLLRLRLYRGSAKGLQA